MSGYVERAITLTIKIGTGSFGNSGSNTVTLAGLRVTANIRKMGGPTGEQADVRVYGLPLAMMNQLSTMGLLDRVRNNQLIVEAGDAINGMAVVFSGIIQDAYADMLGMPDVSFVMHATGAILAALKPVPPSSFPGQANVGTIMASLAALAGFRFVNSGVTAVLANPYFPGTAKAQIDACATHANINYAIDGYPLTLTIWPKGGSRGGLVPVLSPQTGMAGYPSFARNGPIVKALLNPAVQFGGHVKVQSAIVPACGTWYVVGLSYELASQLPGGPWFMTVTCFVAGSAAAASAGEAAP